MYKLCGLSKIQVDDFIDFYGSKKVVTDSIFNESTQLYDVIISDLAIIKINTGDITIDLGYVLYTFELADYLELHITI